MKRCCFAGHSEIYNDFIKKEIENNITKLIIQKNIYSFWVGNYGQFDRYCVSVLLKLKEKYPYITLDLIIPYLTKQIIENQYMYQSFDNIIIADIPQNTPRKIQIIKTNEYMVKNSDILLCYINHTWGGAFKTMEYAKNKHLEICNIGKL